MSLDLSTFAAAIPFIPSGLVVSSFVIRVTGSALIILHMYSAAGFGLEADTFSSLVNARDVLSSANTL